MNVLNPAQATILAKVTPVPIGMCMCKTFPMQILEYFAHNAFITLYSFELGSTSLQSNVDQWCMAPLPKCGSTSLERAAPIMPKSCLQVLPQSCLFSEGGHEVIDF
jgi:hypothetical protein